MGFVKKHVGNGVLTILGTLALLVSMGVPLASAKFAEPHRAMDAYPCQNTAWVIGATSNVGQFTHPEGLGAVTYDLQAKLNVLIDPDRDGLYCGKIQALAHDTLYTGCITFSGAALDSKYVGTEFGAWTSYKCSIATYNFAGPQVTIDCPPGNGYYLFALADVIEFDDTVLTPHWNC